MYSSLCFHTMSKDSFFMIDSSLWLSAKGRILNEIQHKNSMDKLINDQYYKYDISQ